MSAGIRVVNKDAWAFDHFIIPPIPMTFFSALSDAEREIPADGGPTICHTRHPAVVCSCGIYLIDQRL